MRTALAMALLLNSTAAAQEPPPLVASETLAAQVMLDRAGFSPGEIDGRAGANLRRALAAFQRQHALPLSEELDETTWDRLVEVTGDPVTLVTYVMTAAEVAGPFTPTIPADLMKQSTLSALGYRNALEALAERVHAGRRLLRELNPDATFTTAGERIVVPNVVATDSPGSAAPPVPPVTIVVTNATRSLTVEDEGGMVLFHAPVTTGSRHDPLPIGTWKVTGIQRNPVFHYNPDLFWDADQAHAKARIPAGPNNPVGVAWIDLTREHYGIHGTPEPGRVGHTESHGCVRLTNWDIERVLHWARPGTRVVFR